MRSEWYCTDCETRISSDEIDDHEARNHHVKGQLQPDRLIGNDPHNVTVLNSGEEDDESGRGTLDDVGHGDETTDSEVTD